MKGGRFVCFNPRPASSARRTGGTAILRRSVEVSTHAPLHQRGEPSLAVDQSFTWSFQPTPRFISEANARTPAIARRGVSTHAPLHQRGERRRPRDRAAIWQFQPTPRFISEANISEEVNELALVRVSTHAPLHQRGEPVDQPVAVQRHRVSTHAARRTVSPCMKSVDTSSFNPRPASSARRTFIGFDELTEFKVSTHAPLHQRGEHLVKKWIGSGHLFQPTPRFISEANKQGSGRSMSSSCFNPRPASSARRTSTSDATTAVEDVSTHAPLHQRGERDPCSYKTPDILFQPTPRFISEANAANDQSPAKVEFQPTPRFISEANVVDERLPNNAVPVSTHAPLHQRGERDRCHRRV